MYGVKLQRMHSSVSGPSLGCVVRLGYRRPLDDSEHIGDITWAEEGETEANTGDTGARADKRGNSSKGIKYHLA